MGTFIWSNIIKHIVLISLFVLCTRVFIFWRHCSRVRTIVPVPAVFVVCMGSLWLCVPPVVEVYGG